MKGDFHDFTWVEKSMFSNAMEAQVFWEDEITTLYFWDPGRYDRYVNRRATVAFGRPGFAILGPALILKHSDLFYGQSASGRACDVQHHLNGLGLNEAPVILDAYSYPARCNIYSRDKNDAFAIRMRLP